ncbi:hypothetical protein ABZ470_39360 [Streptosporangium sp. NPDC020072]|uniref:hypothetical protein n=1 Tax=Streptosporangium sp. NPDC020072 TaxID=3154788 RepID=UPI0034401D32
MHFSTGRLTKSQAATLTRWRSRLLDDRPLPGTPRKPPSLRFLGIDNRPPASCSDAIAALTEALIRHPPSGLDIARYVDRAITAQKLAGQGNLGPHAPILNPVSFYLTADTADRCLALLSTSYQAVLQVHQQLNEQARTTFPNRNQAQERRIFVLEELARRRVPVRPYRPTNGVLARMAIDRAARRSVDRVLIEAVDYAQRVHDQPHRARRDMHVLDR